MSGQMEKGAGEVICCAWASVPSDCRPIVNSIDTGSRFWKYGRVRV